MLLAKPPAKPDRGVSIDESISRCNRTKLEVVGPAAQFLIQLLHHLSGIQPSHISACLDTHSFSHALDTLPRWTSGDVRPPGPGRIAPTKCVPQEIELFIRNPANPGLFFVHRQLQPVHHPSHGSERLVCTIALAADDQIISIVDDPGAETPVQARTQEHRRGYSQEVGTRGIHLANCPKCGFDISRVDVSGDGGDIPCPMCGTD